MRCADARCRFTTFFGAMKLRATAETTDIDAGTLQASLILTRLLLIPPFPPMGGWEPTAEATCF